VKAYEILFTPGFEKDFRHLANPVRERIRKKILHLSKHPELIRYPLQNLPVELAGLHKYRIGDYRVLFRPDHNKRKIMLYAVAHRREIYRRLGD
jgi:mRNA interferase RelE/StbE